MSFPQDLHKPVAIDGASPSTIALSPGADTGVLPEFWLKADSETLLDEATSHHGACDTGDLDPADLDWRLVVDFPVSTLVPLMTDEAGWREWYDNEIAMNDCDWPERADAYRALMDEPLENPIVISLEPERIQIWDGWHRTATRVIGQAKTIPAIIGTPRCASQE